MSFGLHLAACTGSISGDGPPLGPGSAPLDDGAPSSQPSGNAGTVTAEGPVFSDRDVPGQRPMLRLTAAQYRNSVRDALGVETADVDLSGIDVMGRSGFVTGGAVSSAVAQRLFDAAEAIAGRGLPTLAATLDCGDAASDATCASDFLSKVGKRLFRRPLEQAETDSLLMFFNEATTTLGMDRMGALRLVLSRLLLSPSFLYQWERGTAPPRVEGGLVALSPHEVASRLAYAVWNTIPDDALLAVADAGTLTSAAELDVQVQRLLSDAKATETITAFYDQWLGVSSLETLVKDEQLYPDFGAELAIDMATETRLFVTDVMTTTGKLGELFSAPYSFVNSRLASLYGVTPPAGGGFGKVALDPHQRAGLLTQASFLTFYANAVDSHPVKRGAAIYGNLLCGALPPMPADVPAPKPPTPGLTTRERFAEHSQAACATACHELLDPLGFGLEHYDAIGRYRTTDGGKPVDAAATAKLPSGRALPFDGARAMADALATSDELRVCSGRSWMRFVLGRPDTEDDGRSLKLAYDSFASSDYDVRALLAALVRSRAFLYRTPSPGEL